MKKFGFLLIFLTSWLLNAQNTKKIELAFSDLDVYVGGDFVIEAKVTNIKRGVVPNFPVLPGFKKSSLSIPSQSTTIVNGRYSSVIKYHQYYKAQKAGVFKMPIFTIRAGGASATHGGFKVKVKGLPTGKGNSFLLLETSKDDVYLGEPFKVSLSFVYAEEEYNFLRHVNEYHDRLADIKSKLLKPSFWVEEIETKKDQEVIKDASGKKMIREVLYQVVVVPQVLEDIVLDSVMLEMLKARSTSNGYRWLKTEFYSSDVKVKVKDLPEHPLKGSVPVGTFSLREGIEKVKMMEGENTIYTFEVSGEGNLASLLDPSIIKTDSFLVFKEADRLEYSNDTGRVAGQKIYQYNLVPDKPGIYNVKDYVFFPFFNPSKGVYDTLKSKIRLNVKKDPSRKNGYKGSSSSNNAVEIQKDFVSEEYSSELISIDEPESKNFAIILLLLLIIGGLVYVLVKKIN